MAEKILEQLRRINRAIAILVGLGLMGCAAAVLLDVLLRQIDASFGGTDEISGYAMAIATSWGMAYCMLELGHVRIDLLRTRVRKQVRAAFDIGSMLVLAGTISTIAYWCWPVVARSLANDSRANTPLETPLAWVQLPWFAGWVWFAVMAWLTLTCAAILILSQQWEKSEKAIGAFGEADMGTEAGKGAAS